MSEACRASVADEAGAPLHRRDEPVLIADGVDGASSSSGDSALWLLPLRASALHAQG